MSEATITLRPAAEEDAQAIAALGQETFRRGFGTPCDETALKPYLHDFLGRETVANEIRSKNGYYHVAVTDQLVGFVKYKTWVWTPRFKGKITFEVERLYIRKDMEGQRIGSRLMAIALEAGRKKNYRIIWLSVWEDNDRAIRFHRHQGFEVIGDGVFSLGCVDKKYLVMLLKV